MEYREIFQERQWLNDLPQEIREKQHTRQTGGKADCLQRVAGRTDIREVMAAIAKINNKPTNVTRRKAM